MKTLVRSALALGLLGAWLTACQASGNVAVGVPSPDPSAAATAGTQATASATPAPLASSGSLSGQQAPTAPFLGLDGKSHTLAEYKGKYVLLSFFAYWCPHCQDDLPKIQAQFEAHKADNFAWVPIEASSDGQTETAGFATTYHIDVPVFYDPTGAIPKAFNISAFPTSCLMKPDGTLGPLVVGDISSDEQFKQFMPPSN